MSMVIRPLEAGDKDAWLRLWNDYLDFYRTTLEDGQSETLFNNLVTGAPHFAFVAEKDGAVIGAVHALPHASTWAPNGYCYLEDLFVDGRFRGEGAGRALIEAVCGEAEKRGLSRVYWHTEQSNSNARKLYDKLATLSDFVQYRR